MRVTISFNYELDKYIKPQGKGDGIDDGTDNESVTGKLSDEEKLIKAMEKNPNITTAEMVKLLVKSRRTVARIISKSSKIVRVGGDFAATGKLKDRILAPVIMHKEKRIKVGEKGWRH